MGGIMGRHILPLNMSAPEVVLENALYRTVLRLYIVLVLIRIPSQCSMGMRWVLLNLGA